MTDHAHSILIVDDDEVFRGRLARAFAERQFEVYSAPNAEQALSLAKRESPEFALVDLRMPGASGLDLVRELRAIDVGTRIVVLTGYGSIATAVEAIRLGATHYLTKPVDIDQILAAMTGQASAATTDASVPSLARVEWEHIQRVLADCAGNVTAAARLLGLHRRSLQRKLAKDPGLR
ncbi:MAG TPA: response regulator [Polyangiaceae bacterium]|jgi:two-component system response regulator RegA